MSTGKTLKFFKSDTHDPYFFPFFEYWPLCFIPLFFILRVLENVKFPTACWKWGFFLMVCIHLLNIDWKLTESWLNLKKIQAKFSLQKLFSPWILTENRLKVNWIHYSVHFQFRLDWKLTENELNNEFSQLSVKIQGLNLAWIL